MDPSLSAAVRICQLSVSHRVHQARCRCSSVVTGIASICHVRSAFMVVGAKHGVMVGEVEKQHTAEVRFSFTADAAVLSLYDECNMSPRLLHSTADLVLEKLLSLRGPRVATATRHALTSGWVTQARLATHLSPRSWNADRCQAAPTDRRSAPDQLDQPRKMWSPSL